MKRKRYSRKFQRMAVEQMRTCENVDELARELGVRPRCLYKWRAKLEAIESGEEAARPSKHAAAYRKENQQLKRLLAEKTLEHGLTPKTEPILALQIDFERIVDEKD